MLCLQLNRVPLNNEYLRLPRELLDCCATVAVRPNMSKDLVSAMQRRFQRANRTELFRFGSTEFLKSRFGFGSVRLNFQKVSSSSVRFD
jgi:hypothetical protein